MYGLVWFGMVKNTEKSNQTRCGGGGGVVVVVVWWWCGGFFPDNNTTLGLCWVALGCGNCRFRTDNRNHYYCLTISAPEGQDLCVPGLLTANKYAGRN